MNKNHIKTNCILLRECHSIGDFVGMLEKENYFIKTKSIKQFKNKFDKIIGFKKGD